jgi:monomeric isocitrate dehydrogenase
MRNLTSPNILRWDVLGRFVARISKLQGILKDYRETKENSWT